MRGDLHLISTPRKPLGIGTFDVAGDGIGAIEPLCEPCLPHTRGGNRDDDRGDPAVRQKARSRQWWQAPAGGSNLKGRKGARRNTRLTPFAAAVLLLFGLEGFRIDALEIEKTGCAAGGSLLGQDQNHGYAGFGRIAGVELHGM
jgi:hypothetical protein